MPDVLQWRSLPVQEAMDHIVQRLACGQVAAFPTDTCYIAVASALCPEAVQRLKPNQTGNGSAAPVQLAVGGIGSLLEWARNMPTVGQRFARRIWPGPLALYLPPNGDLGVGERLAPVVKSRLLAEDRFRVRAPCHEAIQHVLQNFPGPLVFQDLLGSDGTEITASEELTQSPPAPLDLIIVDGNTYFSQPASVVEISRGGWKLIRNGVVSEEQLRCLSCCQIVFVCTGNTCRSPLAEALCKKLLAEQLECLPEELPEFGFVVQSAGIAAATGGSASPEAVDVGREMGVDLASHQSQPLTVEMLCGADYVFTMTHGHLQALAGHGMNMDWAPRLLSYEGEDVPDPIGGSKKEYQECAQQIMHYLRHRLHEFQTQLER